MDDTYIYVIIGGFVVVVLVIIIFIIIAFATGCNNDPNSTGTNRSDPDEGWMKRMRKRREMIESMENNNNSKNKDKNPNEDWAKRKRNDLSLVEAKTAVPGNVQGKEKFEMFDPEMIKKHKNYMTQKRTTDKEAETLSKFKKMGRIHIPKEATDATFLQTCKAPDNVVLEKAYFDDKLNEQYDIGTDVDDIELDDDTIAGTSIATTLRDKSLSEKKAKSPAPKSLAKKPVV